MTDERFETWRARVFWGLAILILGAHWACTQSHEVVSPTVEEGPRPVAVQVYRDASYALRVVRFCDEGNLVYVSRTGQGGGIAVVPGGCR